MRIDRHDIEAVKQQLDELVVCQRKLASVRDRVAQARQALAAPEPVRSDNEQTLVAAAAGR